MTEPQQQLILVLQETQALLALPDNDFNWSSWSSAADALRELDEIIAEVGSNRLSPVSRIALLFGPTGSIQEVSISSGWGYEFLDLAARFDDAFAKYQAA